MVLLKKDRKALSIRHLVPFAFVLFLICTLFLGFVNSLFWLAGSVTILLHLLLGICFACKKTSKMSIIMKMPFLFVSLHCAYGLGYIAGLIK